MEELSNDCLDYNCHLFVCCYNKIDFLIRKGVMDDVCFRILCVNVYDMDF